jgi:hypothetical protein
MDLQYLKKLVRLIEQSGVDEIEIEEEGIKIRVAKNSHGNVPMTSFAPAQQIVAAPVVQKSQA